MRCGGDRFRALFPGAARADAAAETRHLRAMAGQPRQQVIQLREFDLQLAFARAGAAGKNIQDELRAVDDFAIERAFEVALLVGVRSGRR